MYYCNMYMRITVYVYYCNMCMYMYVYICIVHSMNDSPSATSATSAQGVAAAPLGSVLASRGRHCWRSWRRWNWKRRRSHGCGCAGLGDSKPMIADSWGFNMI